MLQSPKFDYSVFGSYEPSGRRDKPEIMSLSGGRSSAYTLMMLLNGGFGKANDIVSFQNTGQEDESCYKFLNQLQELIPVPILWLEYTNTEMFNSLIRPDFDYDKFHRGEYDHAFEIVDAKKISRLPKFQRSKNNFWYKEGYSDATKSFKIVDYSTASRNSKPFTDVFLYRVILRLIQGKDLILPNAAQRWCTADMKVKVMSRYLKSIGVERCTHYFGMRSDEPDRIDKMFRKNDMQNIIEYDCPLHWENVDKAKVLQAWSRQPVDLGFDGLENVFRDFLGNCIFCHLKARLKKLYLIQQGYSIAFYSQLERIVNNFNYKKSALSNQVGTMDELYELAMSMDSISINDLLSDSEREIHCFGCGD